MTAWTRGGRAVAKPVKVGAFRAHGFTYVMVSHNLAVVAHLAAMIGVMQEGELVELLSVEDLRAGRTRHPHTAALRVLTLDLEDPETAKSA